MNKPELSKAVESVLTDDFSDKNMKMQTLDLVSKNLLYKDVVMSLISVLPKLKERSILISALNLLRTVNINEIENPMGYLKSLNETLEKTQSEDVKLSLISELERLIPLDNSILAKMLDDLSGDASNEKLITRTLGVILPKINKEDEIIVLVKKGLGYPEYLQLLILGLLQNLKSWSTDLQTVLAEYFDPKMSERTQVTVLNHFSNQAKITVELEAKFNTLLALKVSEALKVSILEFTIKNNRITLDTNLLKDLVDSDPSKIVRNAAQRLIEENSDSRLDQKELVIKQIKEESSLANRLSSLRQATKYMRDEAFRLSLLEVLLDRDYKNFDEFESSFDIFKPYLNREEGLRSSIWSYCQEAETESKKLYLIQSMGQNLNEKHYKEAFVNIYQNDESAEIKETCMSFLIELSLTDSPDLKTTFIDEVSEPSSPYRKNLIEKLSNLEEDESVSAAFEELLENEIDEEILDLVSENYLKSFKKSENRKEYCKLIMKNKKIDKELRTLAVSHLKKEELSESEIEEIKNYVSKEKIGKFDEL